MTLVHFHLTDAEGRGLDGSVSLVPTRRVTVADAIRLPVAQTVRLTAGEATAEVMPSTTQWAWRASELVAGGIVRYVEVPDKESAEYSGLADVDPKTLDQSSETVAAWELVTRAAQGVLDRIGTIDDKVQSAAASAAAAKASETVASQESAKAAAAAGKAQSSQSEAAKSAQAAHESEITANGLIGEAKTIAGQLTETAGQVKQDAATASRAAQTATVKADAAATARDRAETAGRGRRMAPKRLDRLDRTVGFHHTHREDRQCDIPSERSHMADDIITSVVAGLLIAAISAIAAGLWHQLKNLRSQIADEETRRAEHEQLMADMRRGCEHEKLVDEALRTLLLCKLEQQQDTMVHDHHGVADNDFKLRAQRVYDAYHGLGGNGHGTQINNDIQNAPIAPRLGGKPS